jgi:hypothetical protein
MFLRLSRAAEGRPWNMPGLSERARRPRVESCREQRETIVSAGRLPKVRELSPQAQHGIMLGRIGTLLRSQYDNLLKQPVPDRLAALIRKLS